MIIRSKWFGFTGVSLLALVATGCGLTPVPGYRRVETDTPEFKAAVARETDVELSAGRDPVGAAAAATSRVRDQMISADKQRRSEGVSPLLAALEAMDRPRGCWAYTIATTRRGEEKTSVEVERFDPFLPEERIWTLLSRDGRAPTEEEQTSYRRARLPKWKKEQSRASERKTAAERARRKALLARQVEIASQQPGELTSFSFAGGPYRVPLVGVVPQMREVYGIMSDGNRLVSHARTYLGMLSALGGSVVVEQWDQVSIYETVDPDVAPFPRTARVSYRMRAFGTDTGDVIIESVYSDYRRVKCYDDRFEVHIGMPSVQDFIPPNK